MPRTTTLSDRLDTYFVFHESGPLKTTTSPGFRIAEAVSDLLHHDAVTGTSRTAVQCRFHRLGWDEKNSEDKCLKDDAEYQRYADQNREFSQKRSLFLLRPM